jgi:predicted dehydrogenase
VAENTRTVRVAIYGCGRWANRTRIPNLLQVDGAAIVALCDVDPQALEMTAATHGLSSRTYTDGHQMVADGGFDVLYSLVRAESRTDVEVAAAERGIHIFSEKPQALEVGVARRIDEAIQRAGVISTVGFRERYRPIVQEARRLLTGQEIVHVRFQSFRGLPSPAWPEMSTWGGPGINWGVHAVDYVRFMTGLELVRAQGFYCERSAYPVALSQSHHYGLSNGGTMTLSFVMASKSTPQSEPWFVFFCESACLSMYSWDRIEVDGETVYHGQEFDAWLEQDRTFIEAVRTGDASALLNDYHDGMRSLAPVLAGWESARRGGECIEVKDFLEDG